MFEDDRCELQLHIGIRLVLDALRSHSLGRDQLLHHLERLLAEVGETSDSIVLLDGSPADRVHRLGGRLIRIAAGESEDDPVELERVLTELLWVRDHCEDLIFRAEEPIFEPR